MINTEIIKSIREGMGKTPYQFAQYIGIDLKTYKAIERGESVTLKILKQVADKFSLPVKTLLKD